MSPLGDIDNYVVDHTIDLVVLTKYGGDWVSITLNATPELFASGAAFGSPPEPAKQIFVRYIWRCLWVPTRTCKADNVFFILPKAEMLRHSVSLQRAFVIPWVKIFKID